MTLINHQVMNLLNPQVMDLISLKVMNLIEPYESSSYYSDLNSSTTYESEQKKVMSDSKKYNSGTEDIYIGLCATTGLYPNALAWGMKQFKPVWPYKQHTNKSIMGL